MISNIGLEHERTFGPEAVWAGAFGLNTQTLQEGGELDVTDEAKGGEVMRRQVVCPGETLSWGHQSKLHVQRDEDSRC